MYIYNTADGIFGMTVTLTHTIDIHCFVRTYACMYPLNTVQLNAVYFLQLYSRMNKSCTVLVAVPKFVFINI